MKGFSLHSPSQEDQAELAAQPTRSSADRWQLPVALASLLLGVAVSLQYRAGNVSPNPTGAQRDLVATLRAVELERDKLRSELSEQRFKITEIERTLGEGQSSHEQLVNQFEGARLQAGLTALKGPGLVVRLTDSPRQPGQSEDPYDFIVHDLDLTVLVNELWASGAEAVEVNGQRIVARSAIRCVGPTVLVNTNRIASPFIVKAIGDVDHLEGGLKMPGGFLDSTNRLTSNGGEVVISRMREVQIVPYSGSLIYQHAVPITEADKPKEGQ